MHDGRFPTLRAVIDFYNAGVQNNPNLDPILRDPNTGLPRRLNLNENEKQALEAFLRTLSDTGLATDPKFADPFIHTGLGGNNVAD
jgi:cytochrome c peroxidase